jgi:hypothetical protein
MMPASLCGASSYAPYRREGLRSTCHSQVPLRSCPTLDGANIREHSIPNCVLKNVSFRKGAA